jgi:hypothetical protein
MLLLLLSLQSAPGDTLTIRPMERAPASAAALQIALLGPPQIGIRTGQGTASVWLVRARDTVFVAASIPDSTPYWGDDFVISIDTEGDGGSTPQHDDFQLYFRRVLDSSVVYRGRNGRWQPPRDDPDWRLGADRAGGGWEVSTQHNRLGWTLLLRMDPAWLRGKDARLPRIAFRIYDDAPGGWFAWPPGRDAASPTSVERTPETWAPVR